MTNEEILNQLEAVEEEKDFNKALALMEELDQELGGKLEFAENVYTREDAQDMIDNDDDEEINPNLPEGELFWYDEYENHDFSTLDRKMLDAIVSNVAPFYED